MRERVADDLRLLVNLLGHEVAIIAFVHEKGRGRRFEHGALDFAAFGVEHVGALAREHGQIAVLEIGDRVGKRRERDGVGAEIHFALAIADGERRALARADEEIVLAREQEGEREGTAQPRQHCGHRLGRRPAVFHLLAHEMGDDLGVGVGAECCSFLFQLLAQLAEVLDDAVMDDGETVSGVGMGVALGRSAVRRPAGVADADRAGERLAREPRLEIAQLAFGALAGQLPVFQRGDAGGIIASVFEPLKRVDQRRRDRLTPENAYNSAHASSGLLC